MDEETIMADNEERGMTFARAKREVLEMAGDVGWTPSENAYHRWILSLPRTATASDVVFDLEDDVPF